METLTSERMQDPVWPYIITTRIAPYMPAVREFWNTIEDLDVSKPGEYDVKPMQGVPYGLKYRVTNTPVRSPIKNVQVFPFLPSVFLNLSGVPGGAIRLVSALCADNKFVIDEFTVVEKRNLPSTNNQGQFLIIIPTKILNNAMLHGKWIYFTLQEMIALVNDSVLPSVKLKVTKYVK